MAYVILLGLISAGCGVRFRDSPVQSELLVSLSPTSPAESNLVRLELTYRRFYPVPIALTCSLLRSDGREAIPSLRLTIPASDTTATPSTASDAILPVRFSDVPPGNYIARCATDRAADAVSTPVSV